MSPRRFKKLVGNHIFSCVFTKRTTGEDRRMVARLGVTSHLKGGERAYKFEEKKLIGVFDMQKREYRCIPLEGLKSLTVRGKTYVLTVEVV